MPTLGRGVRPVIRGASVIEVIAGAGPAVAPAASLVVRVAPHTAAPAAREATLGVAIADPALAAAVTAALAAAMTEVVTRTFAVATGAGADNAGADTDATGVVEDGVVPDARLALAPDASAPVHGGPPTVRVRSRKSAAERAGELAGAIAIVPVTAANARHLVELVDQLRAGGVAGVQLGWDGADPPRARVERHVFAVLERARATPGQPPVVLAAGEAPAAALQLLIAHRVGSAQPFAKGDVR